jgi:hypothetical protein
LSSNPYFSTNAILICGGERIKLLHTTIGVVTELQSALNILDISIIDVYVEVYVDGEKINE